MVTRFTPGKLAGLKAISDKRAVIAALALDQRGILKTAIARQKGVDHIADSVVVEFKELVTEALTKYASAVLLDPEYGLPATKLRSQKGLLLAYERSCYDAPPPRMPVLYNLWSVRRMKEAGADCIKVLLHYTPFETPGINDRKKAWVERVGDECRANDIPFVLEILGYATNGDDERGLAYAKRKPHLVAQSVEEFGADRYNVDLLKIEIPVQMKFVPATSLFEGEEAYTRAEARQHLRNIDLHTSKPYVYLSAGVTNSQFVEALDLAAESGSKFNGVLCGRATWQDGVPIYAKHGARALQNWLNTTGVENITRVNDALKAAQPWDKKVCPQSSGDFTPAFNHVISGFDVE